ncbi:MAG: non-heme iron oxygenase ferredoxin subunit [Candidatus Zixiibacteriota bacterium]
MNKTYVKICPVNDLEENQTKAFEIGDYNILLAKHNGDVYAFENNCTHENLPLGEQKIIQREIQCPRHGARFDIKTGRAVQFPAVVNIKIFESKIEDDNVLVAL